MAITPAQRNAINEVVNNASTDYASYGTKFLNGASAATAKAVEQEALEHICDADDNVNDIKVLNEIAKWDIQRYSATDLKRKIISKHLDKEEEILIDDIVTSLPSAIKSYINSL